MNTRREIPNLQGPCIILFFSEKTSQMASSPECITWMIVGLTESVTIVVLNSLTGIAFFRELRFGNQPRHQGAANRERKLNVTLFTVTSLSLLLWLPYVITSSLFFATNLLMSLSDIAVFRLQHVSIILLYANSFLNPILYTMRMPGF